MPPKSTFFFPKVLTGIVVQPPVLTAALGSAPWRGSTPRRATTAPPRSGTAGASPSPTRGPRPTARSTRPPRPWAPPARSAGPATSEIARDVLRIQNELFVAGAELATAPEATDAAGGRRLAGHRGDGRLPRRRDRPLHGPGRPAAEVRHSRRHPALGRPRRRPRRDPPGRAASRRARRERGPGRTEVVRYLNRASDAVYAMARVHRRERPRSCSRAATRAPRATDGDRARPAGARGTCTTSRSPATRSSLDEPEASGGTNQGPSPTRLARRRRSRPAPRSPSRCTPSARDGSSARSRSTSRWSTTGRRAELLHRHPADPVHLDADQQERLRVIAGKCPVHRALRTSPRSRSTDVIDCA